MTLRTADPDLNENSGGSTDLGKKNSTDRRISKPIFTPSSGDLLPSMWYSLLRKSVSLDACAADQFYITTLLLTREIFPVKQITIAKTYTSMKARDVKNENQLKSSFFRGNLSPRKRQSIIFHTTVR